MTPFDFKFEHDWHEGEPTWTKRQQKWLRKGQKHYRLAARIVPEGDLTTFGFALAKVTGMDVPPPEPTHRSIAVLIDQVGPTPQRALTRTTYYLDRAIRKTGFKVQQISWDVVPAEVIDFTSITAD